MPRDYLTPRMARPQALTTRRGALGMGVGMTLAAAGLHTPVARAAAYPSRPVTIVMNFPPGAGALTLMVRTLADEASAHIGQPVVVDNKGGAGGNIGAQFVASAKPDGHTLLATVDTTLTVNPSIYSRMPFDAEKSFTLIATLGTFSQMLVVNPEVLPIKSFDELITYAKTHSVHYASAGNGSPGHIACALLAEMAGLRLEHAPYRGNAPATQGVLAGDVPIAFLQSSGVQPHVQSGRLIGLAVSSGQRAPGMLDIPTVAESGYPDFVVEFGWVLAAPAKTPLEAVRFWEKQVQATLAGSGLRQRLSEWNIHPSGAASAETAARLSQERARWARVTQRAGIRVDG